MVEHIDHIGWAVSPQLAEAVRSHLKEVFWKTSEERKLNIGFMREHSGGAVEFLEPLEGEKVVSRFLEKFGAGFHHLCLGVKDLEGLYENLKSRGVKVIGEPSVGAEGRHVFFVHPEEAGGILIEFIEVRKGEDGTA